MVSSDRRSDPLATRKLTPVPTGHRFTWSCWSRRAAGHALLVTEAESLANRKLLERSRIEPSRAVQGYRTVVTSTLTLVDLDRKIWPQIADKTFLTTADLDRIEQSYQAMLDPLARHPRRSGRSDRPGAKQRWPPFTS